MARYIICPRCELNFIDADEQEFCEVCIKELRGETTFTDDFEKETEEETELCPICGENYMRSGEKMCDECKKKSEYEEELGEDDENDDEWMKYVEDDENDDLDIPLDEADFDDDEEVEEEDEEETKEDDFEYVSADDYYDFDDEDDEDDDEEEDF